MVRAAWTTPTVERSSGSGCGGTSPPVADREWTVHDLLSEGDKVVARYSGWATYRGGLLDITSEDQRVLETGILIFRVEDGMVKEIWSEMSDLQVVMQLSAFPVPEAP